MQQLDMLTTSTVPPPMSRRTDPQTSRIAAERLRASGELNRQERAVLAAVTRWPGSTAVELAKFAELDRYAVSRRLPELQRKGQVRRGPPRDCTVNGRAQCAWRPA
jgi:DNA-binding MarR family transcriptional regulator